MHRSDAGGSDAERRRFRVHLTNVVGLGASRLVASVLPAMESRTGFQLDEMYLPVRGPLADYRPQDSRISVVHYRRRLPNSISRVVECTVGSRRFDGDTPLLVLGDLPLRVRCRQTVFVQQRFLLDDDSESSASFALKVAVLRRVFAMNADRVSRFIVQGEPMKSALAERYGVDERRVRLIPQPAPAQIIESGLRRTGRVRDGGLALFYPAAPFPHKNHRLLGGISAHVAPGWGVAQLILSIPRADHPNVAVPWIECVGALGGADVLARYATADALLFLSTKESFGVPLVEAMSVGLPIVCANVPYARDLCGETAIYFEPGDLSSLHAAVAELRTRLDNGWWPDWSRELQRLPSDWGTVAEAMLSTLFD